MKLLTRLHPPHHIRFDNNRNSSIVNSFGKCLMDFCFIFFNGFFFKLLLTKPNDQSEKKDRNTSGLSLITYSIESNTFYETHNERKKKQTLADVQFIFFII